MMNIHKVGTHHGKFHADDVVAYVILEEVFGTLELVRTRDEDKLAECDLVFDVGGGKFDHHTTEKEYRKNGIPFAATGLIWREFGETLLRQKGIQDEDDLAKIHRFVDAHFMEGLDAIDNGVNFKREVYVPELASLISTFNPSWDKDEDENEKFLEAAAFARTAFRNFIDQQVGIFKAKSVVKEAFEKREQKEIVILKRQCPWKQALLEVDKNEDARFVILPDSHGGYLIQVVPVQLGSFDARKDLPEEWAGKRSEELNSIIDIDDAVFCHPGRFIAGAKSKESILKMATLAVEN